MKHYIRIAVLAILLLPVFAIAQSESFSTYFSEGSLRVDYFLGGSSKSTIVFFDEMLREPYWGGVKTLPAQQEDAGTFRYNFYDSATGKLLCTKGFIPLFQEWQSTDEAKYLQRCMPMTAHMPFPKKAVKFEVQERKYADGKFETLYSMNINPSDYFIRPELRRKYEARKLVYNGDPATHVDLVFIAEGYTEAEKEKFYKDASRMSSFILNQEPYSKYKDKFNVYAIAVPSIESGTDVPGKGTYKNTFFNSSYYTFDVSRYLTITDTKTISDVAANVPYDAIFLIVNSPIYGGGGFYNWYCMGTADHPLSDTVAIHEFGHSFAGLADEYFDSETAYNDFYNLKVEPWEPNITTNVNFASKWKDMIGKNTPVPTPRTEAYKDKVGMFEGGGYVSKGIFSPVEDCRMRSNKAKYFCPVCMKAIEKRIKYYCGEK